MRPAENTDELIRKRKSDVMRLGVLYHRKATRIFQEDI